MVLSDVVAPAHGLSERAYRTVFARTPDTCFALERGTGRIMRCNESVRGMLGYSPREVVGHSILALAHPDTLDRTRRTWLTLASRLSLPATDVDVLRKDGGKAKARLTAAGVRDRAGAVAFGVVLLRLRKADRGGSPADVDHPARLRALLYTLSVAEERERRRIAAGLHDDLGQLLAIAKLKLGRLGTLADGAERDALTNEIRDLIDQAVRSARSTTFELSSPVLHQLGLKAAIESVGERMEGLYGFRFRFEGDSEPVALREEAGVVLLRVVRELLFNVHKHASATCVDVSMRLAHGWLTIVVRDDGDGFSAEARGPSFGPGGGFGLFSAEAQVHAVGGQLRVDSAPGQGVCVTIEIPVRDDEAAA
ncbi:MAG: PAS domain S-box protein [Betaproteobacteria bacterium]|nr:PAS domain S-box protein [Betaproteobacteria bacterium]